MTPLHPPVADPSLWDLSPNPLPIRETFSP